MINIMINEFLYMWVEGDDTRWRTMCEASTLDKRPAAWVGGVQTTTITKATTRADSSRNSLQCAVDVGMGATCRPQSLAGGNRPRCGGHQASNSNSLVRGRTGNSKKKSQPNKGKVGTDWRLQHSSSQPLDAHSSITQRTARTTHARERGTGLAIH